MANDDNAADRDTPRPRTAPTIDLKATEVSSAPAEDDARKADPAAQERLAAASEPEEPAPAKPARAGMSLRMAGVVGALSALAFFTLGAWLGAVYRHEEPLRVAQPQPQSAPAEVAAPNQANAELMKPLEEGIAGLHRRLDELATATNDTRARAEQAAAAAESARRSGSDGIGRGDVDALVNRLTALEQAVTAKASEPDKKPADTAEADRRIRLAIAAVEVRGAVERGQPYAGELAALRGLSADAGALVPLQPFAAAGVPSSANLSRELTVLAPAILHADKTEGGGLLERLQARASRLVSVRPRGEVEGEEPPQIVARAEAKAARGDLVGAAAELERLPAPSRGVAQGWIDNARRREAALDASRALALDALKAVGKPGL